MRSAAAERPKDGRAGRGGVGRCPHVSARPGRSRIAAVPGGPRARPPLSRRGAAGRCVGCGGPDAAPPYPGGRVRFGPGMGEGRGAEGRGGDVRDGRADGASVPGWAPSGPRCGNKGLSVRRWKADRSGGGSGGSPTSVIAPRGSAAEAVGERHAGGWARRARFRAGGGTWGQGRGHAGPPTPLSPGCPSGCKHWWAGDARAALRLLATPHPALRAAAAGCSPPVLPSARGHGWQRPYGTNRGVERSVCGAWGRAGRRHGRGGSRQPGTVMEMWYQRDVVPSPGSAPRAGTAGCCRLSLLRAAVTAPCSLAVLVASAVPSAGIGQTFLLLSWFCLWAVPSFAGGEEVWAGSWWAHGVMGPAGSLWLSPAGARGC